MYETAKETLMYRTVLWTLWERERVGRFGRMAMKHVKYQESEIASLRLNNKKKKKLRLWHPPPILHGKWKSKMWK